VFQCPCCGFEQLDFEPWIGDSPADEICPCCGIQFGLDDFGRRDQLFYAGWRSRWILDGSPWFSRGRPAPEGWSAQSQIERLSEGGF